MAAEEEIKKLTDKLPLLKKEIGKVIVGQEETIEHMLITFLAGGHALLEGVPGLAKTLLIKTISQAIDLEFNRIQFTPDLMPSDIVGTEILEEDHTTGNKFFKFNKGPIFANIVLADEINRTPPKTQAALLEAMHEAGEIRINDPEIAAEQFVAMCKGMGDLERRFGMPRDENLDARRIEAAVEAFCRAYAIH